MDTVNGKLITQELKNFDELNQRNDRINQRFESLEAQLIAMRKQDYTEYLENVTQEVSNQKSYLQKLEQKIGFLDDLISRQAKQLFLFRISIVIILIGLGFMFYMNNQPKPEKNNPKKKAESLELIKPKARQKFLPDI